VPVFITVATFTYSTEGFRGLAILGLAY